MHYLLINMLVDSLERDGFSVLADHVDGRRRKPAPIGDFTPDIEARRGQEVHLIEVKTRSTLGANEAGRDLRSLTSFPGGRAYLAVPFDCTEAARRLREDTETDFAILPCYPFVRYVGMPK
jgi:Holliday junction resolvase